MAGIKNKIKLSYEESHKVIDNVVYKLCNKCWNWFPLNTNYFYNNIKAPDGHFPYCILCTIKKSEKWAVDNPEWYKQICDTRNENNKRDPKIVECRRKNGQKRRDSGEYYEWLRNNPDKQRKYYNDRQNKNHKISNKEWNECKKYFIHRCAYCGLAIEDHWVKYRGEMRNQDLHKEHVIHDGANDISNCVPSCKQCNCEKWEYEFDYWYNENNLNFTKERYDKIIKWITEDYKKFKF